MKIFSPASVGLFHFTHQEQRIQALCSSPDRNGILFYLIFRDKKDRAYSRKELQTQLHLSVKRL